MAAAGPTTNTHIGCRGSGRSEVGPAAFGLSISRGRAARRRWTQVVDAALPPHSDVMCPQCARTLFSAWIDVRVQILVRRTWSSRPFVDRRGRCRSLRLENYYFADISERVRPAISRASSPASRYKKKMSRSARPCSAACGRARTTQAACPYDAKPVSTCFTGCFTTTSPGPRKHELFGSELRRLHAYA